MEFDEKNHLKLKKFNKIPWCGLEWLKHLGPFLDKKAHKKAKKPNRRSHPHPLCTE